MIESTKLLPTSLRRALLDYVQPMGSLYPGIDQWMDRTLTDVERGQRAIRIVLDHLGVAGLTIVKYGVRAKLCTLHVHERARALGVGQLLVHTAIQLAGATAARSLYVTFSEAIKDVCLPFFTHMGLHSVAVVPNRYVPGVDEFVSEATINPALYETQTPGASIGVVWLGPRGSSPIDPWSRFAGAGGAIEDLEFVMRLKRDGGFVCADVSGIDVTQLKDAQFTPNQCAVWNGYGSLEEPAPQTGAGATGGRAFVDCAGQLSNIHQRNATNYLSTWPVANGGIKKPLFGRTR